MLHCTKNEVFLHSLLRIWSRLVKESLKENFIFYAVPSILIISSRPGVLVKTDCSGNF